MNFKLNRLVETEEGVYQPPALAIEATLLLLAGVLAVAWALSGRVSIGHAALYIALLLVPLGVRLHTYRKHGALGRPHVVLSACSLILNPPDHPRSQVKIPLADLRQLTVYGLVGRRIYRFVRHDSSFVEVAPLWGRRVEAAVIAFLQRALPAIVTVAEPQTLFASIRGDGP